MRRITRCWAWTNLWWKIIPGQIIEVKWPRGWCNIDDSGENQIETADPNSAYRWFLEKYVGEQGISWDWKISECSSDSLKIKIRYGKSVYATMLALKWN